MLRGFDVSHHNGSVDWALLKTTYGLAWGAAKATEAEATFMKDAQFPANWRKMKAAGLVRMAYNFAHPDNDPSDDALSFLAYIKASGGIEPTDIMVMDMEANQLNLPMLQVRDWLAGWADIVTRETGRKPFLYTGSGYIQNNATKDLRSHYAAWWYPQYPSAYDGKIAWPKSISGYPATNNWGGPPDIWQFSQSFGGSRDANIANMTLADLQTRGTKTPPPPPSKPPVKPPTGDVIDMATQAEVAQAVSDGMRAYLHDFYSPTGTGQTLRNDAKQNAQAVVDATKAASDANVAALGALTDAVKALTDAVQAKA